MFLYVVIICVALMELMVITEFYIMYLLLFATNHCCLWYKFCSDMLQFGLSVGSIWTDMCSDCCADCLYTTVKKGLQCLGSWVS